MGCVDVKQYRLNEVCPVGECTYGSIFHEYLVRDAREDAPFEDGVCIVRFQKGMRGEFGSVQGVSDIDLLEILRHRLYAFECTEMSSNENKQALVHIEEALKLLHQRVVNRVERGVIGMGIK
jgi:hypothetical protein